MLKTLLKWKIFVALFSVQTKSSAADGTLSIRRKTDDDIEKTVHMQRDFFHPLARNRLVLSILSVESFWQRR